MERTKLFSVLITDDDRGCREALRDIFEPEGYRTLLAASGEEAVDIVQGEPVHIALFDMHMPRLTGLETLHLVRQFNQILPCILVTADHDESLMRQAIREHVYSVIPKPINKNVVLYTVIRALMKVYGELFKAQDEGVQQVGLHNRDGGAKGPDEGLKRPRPRPAP